MEIHDALLNNKFWCVAIVKFCNEKLKQVQTIISIQEDVSIWRQ